MDELNILYDHYKSTFDFQISYLHKRNKYFLILLVLTSLLLFKAVHGHNFELIVNSYIKKLSGEKIGDSTLFDSLLLFSILWVSMLYYKIVITVNRGYDYLHKLEEDINSLVKTIKIEREGAFYKTNKTSFSKFAGYIYRFVFPFTLVAVCVGTAIFSILEDFDVIKVVNSLFALLVFVITCLFVFGKKG